MMIICHQSCLVIICQGRKLTSRFVNPCGTTLTARGQRETERSARSQDVRMYGPERTSVKPWFGWKNLGETVVPLKEPR